MEDDEASDALITLYLRNLCEEIIHAGNGKEAVELCRKNEDIDVIFMDIKLPVIDGYQATREIRGFNDEVAIIAQTAFSFPGDKEKAMQCGCDDYITKPINKELFIKCLERINKRKPDVFHN